MTVDNPLRRAYKALDEADETLQKLEDGCCQPDRSPSMEALGRTLAQARTRLDHVGSDAAATGVVLAELEDAGAQIGRLQIGCCAPARMPLYASMLKGLTSVQLTVNRATRTS